MPATTDFLASTFGVEIECYLPEGSNSAGVAAAVASRLGSASSCVSEAYNHVSRPHWKIVPDGSLGDYTRGIELVSPILRGDDGLAQIETVCKALTDFGCTVNKKCGLHVHVGVGSQPVTFFKNLVKLYSLFEPVIDSMLPASRRANQNLFCRSMTSCSPVALDRAATFDQVVHAATGAGISHERRYYKVNLVSYNRHRTVEFRQHSATLDGMKARRWTVLCLRMVAAAKRNDLGLAPTPTVNSARPGSKAHAIGQMLLRSEGVSAREVCVAMNWPSVSLPQQARMCGLQFTTQRIGREVRYYAVQAEQMPSPTPVSISVDGMAEYLGAAEEERVYMRQRVTDLGGSVAWAA